AAGGVEDLVGVAPARDQLEEGFNLVDLHFTPFLDQAAKLAHLIPDHAAQTEALRKGELESFLGHELGRCILRLNRLQKRQG
ncbi:MAG: hypothetical protein V3S98_04805, partial [Dehalococcoidia bacterium]